MTVIDADAHLFRRYVAQHGGILGAFAGCHLDAGVADIGWLVLRGGNKQAAGSGQTQTDCASKHVIPSSERISTELFLAPQGGSSIYPAAILCVLRRATGKNLHSAVSNICPPPTAAGTAFGTGVV